MRIIAGSKRGMRLLPPKGQNTRPITDRVKESLFSVLYKYDVIDGGIVSDLFCGTGSLGLEALSRGAQCVCFIEKDRKAVELLNKNIAKAGFIAQSKVIYGNAFKIGAPPGEDFEKCGLVFIDPPYEMSYDVGEDSRLAILLELLCGQISDKGIVVVRTSEKTQLLDEYGKLHIIDRRHWGTMKVAILQFMGAEEMEQ
jgi:16S rRNA (guanine966-N2)-methyltransferase